MKPFFGSLIVVACGVVALTVAGCVMGAGGQVADEWELVGPFKALASKKPARPPRSNRREQPVSAPTNQGVRPTTTTDESEERFDHSSATSVASSNGFFSLRPAELDLTIREEGDEESAEVVGPAIDPAEHGLFAPVEEVEDTFWYLDLGFRMGITRLSSTKARLDRRLDLPRKVDVFGVFKNPMTPIDRKSEFGLTTSYIGIGRRETEWLTWNFYFGGGVGGDRDSQRWLTANQEVNFDYAMYFTGVTVDIYPWGLSQRGRYVNMKEQFKASRPYLVTGIEIGYLRARGWGHFALAPFRIYSDSQRIEDWLFSYLIGFGWEVPLNERWSFSLQVHHTFHLYRPEEYNSWNLTHALRYRF